MLSAAETAFVLVNKVKIELKARRDNLSARVIGQFSKRPERFFSAVLLSRIFLQIVFALLGTQLLLSIGAGFWTIFSVLTVSLLFIGDLLPRAYARENIDSVLDACITPVKWLSIVAQPVSKSILLPVQLVTGKKKIDEHAFQNFFEHEDFEELVNESREEGVDANNEGAIIHKVLRLRNQKVMEAMRPRTEIVGVEIGSTVEEALALFIESGFSKLPVYEDNLDHIKGVIKAYDMFNNPARLEDIIREVLFVPEARKSIDMLSDFLNTGISFAVVIDEFGGTAGIVTMEDIVEELFGEIKDEYDIEEDVCRKVNSTTVLVNGKIEIDYLNERFGINIPDGDYETVSGFITTHVGRIPVPNENLFIAGFNVHVIRATPVRIEMVKITAPNELLEE